MLLTTLVAFADEIPACQPYVWASVPAREATDVPRDIAPLLFVDGGCDEPATIEVFAGSTSVASQPTVLDGFQTLTAPYSDWEPGPYTIALTRETLLVDQVSFAVVDALAPAVQAPQAQITATSPDRYDLELEVVLESPDAHEVLAIEHPNGRRIELPASAELFYRFGGGYLEDEVCLDLISRGLGATWSDPVQHCVPVTLLEVSDDEKGCACNGTPSAPWLLGVLGLLGLRRRQLTK